MCFNALISALQAEGGLFDDRGYGRFIAIIVGIKLVSNRKTLQDKYPQTL